MGAGDEEQSAFVELRGIRERVLAEQLIERDVVGAGDAPEGFAGMDAVEDAGLGVAADCLVMRAGAQERRDRHQSRTSPARSHPRSSSTRAY